MAHVAPLTVAADTGGEEAVCPRGRVILTPTGVSLAVQMVAVARLQPVTHLRKAG